MSFSAAVFDRVNKFWEKPAVERGIGAILLWIYLCALTAAELLRQGLWPASWPAPPASHFFSIQLAFTLILGMEVISLIFILPASLSRSIGKQLEILTLILLRNAFKELSYLPEPVAIDMNNLHAVVDIGVSAAGALCVFLCLGFYRMIARKYNFMTDKTMIAHYVEAKKLLSLCMLILFAAIGVYDLTFALGGGNANFFETIYTLLIFADIAMVLIAQRYMPCYYAVFRNSGFVIGTLMMRLSLSAPPLLCSAMALFAALYVLALAWGTNAFMPNYGSKPGCPE